MRQSWRRRDCAGCLWVALGGTPGGRSPRTCRPGRLWLDAILLRYALDLPDVFGILPDGTVAGKCADPRYVKNSLAGPGSAVFEPCAGVFLHGNVRRQIRQVEIRIPMV